MPIRIPNAITPITDTMVNIIPSEPLFSAVTTFMPNPSPTTEA